jgi:hypothetical protein
MSKNDFVKEIDIVKYKEYILEKFKDIKLYCDYITKGHSLNIPTQRNNKINLLLTKNETYLSAISEAEINFKNNINKIEYFLNKNIDNYSIDDKVTFLEGLANEISKFRDYSEYISKTLDNLSSFD